MAEQKCNNCLQSIPYTKPMFLTETTVKKILINPWSISTEIYIKERHCESCYIEPGTTDEGGP